MTKERLSAFCDAIIAIIMTILVLELEKPSPLTWSGIWELRASYIAFAVSFFGLAVTWADWNREWHDVQRISDGTVWSMMTLLFLMAFIPYTTGLIAADPSNPVGLILYGGIVTGFTLANSFAYRSVGVIEENASINQNLLSRSKLLAINTVIMLICLLLSVFVWAYFSLFGIAVISLIFALPHKSAKKSGENNP